MKPMWNREECLATLRAMLLSRLTDEKMAKLVRQNKGATFQLSAAGHELVGVVAARALTPGLDWGLPYYRDQPFAIGLGCDLKEIFAAFLARELPHHSGGRMMPGHFSHKELKLACQSSVVGSQVMHAVGIAHGLKLAQKSGVVYVSCGDGATSQGDFHEALNYAAIHRLPVIFVIQDNGWAISVPRSEQTAGESISSMVSGYSGVTLFDVDGTSYPHMAIAVRDAVTIAREGEGPSVIVAHVPRVAPHSSSDDPQKYKKQNDFSEDQERDPLLLYPKWLVEEGICTEEEIAALRKETFELVEQAAAAADHYPYPDPSTVKRHCFVEGSFDKKLSPSLHTEGEKIVIMDALTHALDEEMARDPGVVVFGQDVAHGKGGVFGVTKGLTAKYGDRCFNTPLAESTIVGVAIGMSLDGFHKPVAEIQFCDYLWTGINQLFNELSSFHYRSNGEWNCPVVLRMPTGGYIQGGPYHSQCIEGFLAHCPGLIIAFPSNAADAKALLKAAIRDPNPVIFLEHKALYRQQKFCARVETGPDDILSFGQAAVVRAGSHVTVVTWGMGVLMAVDAADKLAQEGILAEVIDIRTIVPLDKVTILESVKKTGKLLVFHEAAGNAGFGAEIAAMIAEEAFQYLDAPIRRLTGLDIPVPYSKILESAVLPQPEQVENAIRELAVF